MAEADEWPAMPTETEIYLLPSGEVVFADMPVELNRLAAELGAVEGCAIEAVADEEPEIDGFE
ncbi:MAG: hypothetical protein HC802_23660 [Caldilineaceae bacterium]|nr:hypothetical protein [Caldilineaceae bacterium]